MRKTQKFKVKVSRDLCIGAASCEAIAPKVFNVDREGKVVVVSQGTKPDENGFIEVTKDNFDNVLAAAKSCPVFAITVIDKKGKQIYP